MAVSHAFSLEDVSKRFGARWALARVTFALPVGRSLLLTGHNGSGKSTLLSLLAGAAKATRGVVNVLGADAAKGEAAQRRRVALLGHESFLYEDLTAQENLKLLGRLIGLADPVAEAEAVLKRVSLESRAHHAVRSFSAGMRKRLAVARVILKKPELVLLDEPFGELDPQGIAAVEKLIGELRTGGTTLVLSTHQVEQGRALCDSSLHLNEGRVEEAKA